MEVGGRRDQKRGQAVRRATSWTHLRPVLDVAKALLLPLTTGTTCALTACPRIHFCLPWPRQPVRSHFIPKAVGIRRAWLPGMFGNVLLNMFSFLLLFWARGGPRSSKLLECVVTPPHIPLRYLTQDFARSRDYLLRMDNSKRSGIHGCMPSQWIIKMISVCASVFLVCEVRMIIVWAE